MLGNVKKVNRKMNLPLKNVTLNPLKITYILKMMHLHKTDLDKRDDLIKLLIKKNEELVAKQSILERKNRTLRETALKNQEKKPFYRKLLT